MSGRWRWVVLAAILVLAAVGGGAYVGLSHPSRSAAPPAAARASQRLPVLASPATSGVPDALAVARRLAPTLADPAFGGRLSGEVVDGVTGRVLLDRAASTPLPPASTVKLMTAVAALDGLGPQGVLSTGVVRAGDTLYLVGGGDVTLASRPSRGYPPVADLSQLATKTVLALGGTTRVRLCADVSAWTGPTRAPGWRTGYFTAGDVAPLSPLEVDEAEIRAGQRPRVADPAAQAVTAFAAALKARGVVVTGPPCTGPAPSSGLGLASVASAPVAALVQRMLTISDNDLAEALGRTLARRAGLPGSFDGAAAAVRSRVAALGVDVRGVSLGDASGLSRLDRVPPRTLVELLQVAASADHPALRPVLEGLPVAGFTGTLADRYRRPPATLGAGIVHAKTGTLAGVNTIAGTVLDRDGRLLVFAFMTDRAIGPSLTEAALDRVAARLAGCGCS